MPKDSDKTEEKPTGTLGVKDEKNNSEKLKITSVIIAGIGILFLIILLFFKRKNTKIYVVEDENKEEFVLGGIDKVNSKEPKLNIDKYLDGETYPNKVKIRLNDIISEKLDGKDLEIKHRGNIIKYKIKYEGKPYEIILDAISKVETSKGKIESNIKKQK